MISPKVSILTSSWNRGKYLSLLYDSLHLQSYDNFEWVIGDDGSSDNTKNTIENLALNTKFPIVFIRSENRIGKPAIDNLMLQNSSSEYILWVDSDDVLLPDALESLVSAMYENGNLSLDEKIIASVGLNIDITGKFQTKFANNSSKASGVYSDKALHNIMRGDATYLFKRSCIGGNQFPEVDFICTEQSFWSNVFRNNKFILIDKIVKIMDRTAENSVSFGSKLRYCRGSLFAIAMSDNIDRFSKLGYTDRFKLIVNYWRYSIHADFKIMDAFRLWEVTKSSYFFLLFYPFGFLLSTLDSLRRKVEKTHLEFDKSMKNKAICITTYNSK